MNSINVALQDLVKIIRAFKREVPDNIVKASLTEIIGLVGAITTNSSISLGIVGTNFENLVTIDGKKAVLPDGTKILVLSGHYFLANDNVQDEIARHITYSIGLEITDIKIKTLA